MDTTDWQKYEARNDEAREAVRAALNAYAELLHAGTVLATRGSERDRQARASLVQVESAKRVLWMEDN